MRDEAWITFTKREIVIPLFRVGVPDYRAGDLVKVWEQFKDWRDGSRK